MNQIVLNLMNHFEIGLLVGFFLVVIYHNLNLRIQRVEVREETPGNTEYDR